MSDGPQMCEAFYRICELANALKVPPLNTHEACWEYQVDERWFIALNGHDVPMKLRGRQQVEVQPFRVYIEYNGWPAGVMDYGGGIIAAGEAANEETFIAALQAATARARQAGGLAS